jgi:Complex I intermediate-associated protein 30 (CIA30)
VKAYQANFDTAEGDWTTVRLPWHEFVPVEMAKHNLAAGKLDPSKISTVGLVYSRFDLNDLANPNYKPGVFPTAIKNIRMPL